MITRYSDGTPIGQDYADALSQPYVSFAIELHSEGARLDCTVMELSVALGAGMGIGDGDETFTVGDVYATQVEAKLYDAPDLVGKAVEVRVGALVGQAYRYVTVATATVTEQSTWKGVSDVRASGNAAFMDVPAGLQDGDMQPQALALALSSALGFPVAVSGFQPTCAIPVRADMTCRQAVAQAALVLGGFAYDSGDGTVRVAPFPKSPTYTVPADYVTRRPSFSSEQYAVDGLTVVADAGTFSFGTGRVTVSCPEATQETAGAAWANLQGVAFVPGSFDVAVIDPRVTPADMAQVTVDGETRRTLTRGVSARFDGGYYGTYSAAGLTASGEASEFHGMKEEVDLALRASQEAVGIAEATGQHFWHRSENPDFAGAGAFVTDMTREDFLDGAAHAFPDVSDSKPYSNVLLNAGGLLVRRARSILASFSRSAVAFYDGLGNATSNVVATFGSDGAQIGKTGKSHIRMDYHSMEFIDSDGDTYFWVSDLRDQSGVAQVGESFQGNGARYRLRFTPVVAVDSVRVDGSDVGYTLVLETSSVVLDSAIGSDKTLDVVYRTRSNLVKGYTAGFRDPSGSVGPVSFAEGSNTVSSAFSSHAEGNGTEASGGASHAEGTATVASGHHSHAEGWQTEAAGTASHAEGIDTHALYNYSHTEGGATYAKTIYAHAEGQFTSAEGVGAHAEGAGESAAEPTVASGRASHAEGWSCTASGPADHAEGIRTSASGGYSHAEGGSTVASGTASHAEGSVTEASGDYSHAEGVGSDAAGVNSHAQNRGTVASSRSQTAIGEFNIDHGGTPAARSNPAFVVGNGTTSARSDAFRIDWDGAVWTANPAGTRANLGLGALAAKDSLAESDIPPLPASKIGSGTLAVARGGTGQSGDQVTTTASSIITAASGITIVSAVAHKWGPLCQLSVVFKRSTDIAANGLVTVGTIASAFRPANTSFVGSNRFIGNALNGGSLQVRNMQGSTATAGTEYTVAGTYFL